MAKIYHNPRCGTSRNTLKILQDSGEPVEVVEYLKTPLSRESLLDLFAAAGETPGTALRRKQKEAGERGLLEEGVSDDQILDAMMDAPILIERPFVVTAKGAALCRPYKKVYALMENPPVGADIDTGKGVKS